MSETTNGVNKDEGSVLAHLLSYPIHKSAPRADVGKFKKISKALSVTLLIYETINKRVQRIDV